MQVYLDLEMHHCMQITTIVARFSQHSNGDK